MRIIADFHIHSKYSRATSKNLDLHEIAKWSKIKGLTVVSCGDFTHPKWFTEIKNNLIEDGSGLLHHQSFPDVKFILGTEVACIYRHRDATRRLHHVILAPSIATVEKINTALTARGCKLASDGRPILGMSSKELLQLLLGCDSRIALIPAHIWTPWFALFGSKSGYDTVEECFEDLAPHIFALETGLSSDPEMNWSLSQLDRYSLVSNSDAHSGPKLGREANIFSLDELSYDAIISALKDRDKNSFIETIEFFPEEGMYHFDGHRACEIGIDPAQTKKYKGVCPVCKKQLTIGVLHRVDNLRDREYGFKPDRAVPFKKIVPLPSILADYFHVADTSKKVSTFYERIVASGGNEFSILLDLDEHALGAIMPTDLAEGILRVRAGNISIQPGYDGKYGIVSVFSASQRAQKNQRQLF